MMRAILALTLEAFTGFPEPVPARKKRRVIKPGDLP